MRLSAYLDTVTRLDGVSGYIVAPHPEYNIWCVKWDDEPDPHWASPDLIINWYPGSGIDRMLRQDTQRRLDDLLVWAVAWEESLRLRTYDPLDFIH